MFRGKYAQKDVSKVNMYEIAQLSRDLAKSGAEMERTSKGEGLKGKRTRNRETFLELDNQIVNKKVPPAPVHSLFPLFVSFLYLISPLLEAVYFLLFAVYCCRSLSGFFNANAHVSMPSEMSSFFQT